MFMEFERQFRKVLYLGNTDQTFTTQAFETEFCSSVSAQSLKHHQKTESTWQLSTCSAGIATIAWVETGILHVSLEE